MLAASKVSRLAMGTRMPRPTAVEYMNSPLLWQEDRISPDLPFGSRGGIAVRHTFPVDGEYEFHIRIPRKADFTRYQPVLRGHGAARGADRLRARQVDTADRSRAARHVSRQRGGPGRIAASLPPADDGGAASGGGVVCGGHGTSVADRRPPAAPVVEQLLLPAVSDRSRDRRHPDHGAVQSGRGARYTEPTPHPRLSADHPGGGAAVCARHRHQPRRTRVSRNGNRRPMSRR